MAESPDSKARYVNPVISVAAGVISDFVVGVFANLATKQVPVAGFTSGYARGILVGLCTAAAVIYFIYLRLVQGAVREEFPQATVNVSAGQLEGVSTGFLSRSNLRFSALVIGGFVGGAIGSFYGIYTAGLLGLVGGSILLRLSGRAIAHGRLN